MTLEDVPDDFNIREVLDDIIANWKDIEKKTDWGVLILVGGGLTLSTVLVETGASLYLAQQVGSILGEEVAFLVMIVTVIAFVIFLTEVASNTASAALLVPIFAALATALGFDSEQIVLAVAISASCAFMLPVATPPNAIVYGSGFVPQRQMMRVGFFLNLLSIVLITFLVSLF